MSGEEVGAHEDCALALCERSLVAMLRPLLTYALPYFAVQARIELARVHLALADLPRARTLIREVDGLLRLAKERGPSMPGRQP